jgi:hypothetical protein
VTQQPSGSGPDLIGEFQRWLIRSSARGVGRQVTGQIRTALGQNQKPTGDVWETATSEPPEEAPECAWCPLCRAARLLRETKPVRDNRVTAVSDALGTVVQDAFSVLEAALATTGRAAGGDARRTGYAGSSSPAGKPSTASTSGTAGKPGTASTSGTAGRPGTASTSGTAGRPGTASASGTAGKPGTASTSGAAAKPSTAGKPSTVGKPGTASKPSAAAKPSAASKPGTAQPKPADTAAAENGHGAAKPKPGGAAGHGPGKEPKPDSPEGSPHEPDDRG